jgi:hypothetical protein
MLAQCLDQWCEQLAGRSYPTCHRGAVKIDALASVDLCLAVQRAMIGIFCDEHMRQQSRSCEATLDHARWRRRFDNALAPGAGKLRPHMANHLEVSWNVLQHLGYILAEVAQRFAAIGAAVLLRKMGYDFAGKMRGKRLAGGPGLRLGLRCGRFYACFSRGLRSLQLFQAQFELFELDRDLLALGPKHHALQLLDDQAQTLDLMALRGERFQVRRVCLPTLRVLLDD